LVRIYGLERTDKYVSAVDVEKCNYYRILGLLA